MTRMGDRVVTLACACAAVGLLTWCLQDRSISADGGEAGESAAAEGPAIAVLDVKRVFQQDTTFQEALKELRNHLAAVETDLLPLKSEAEAIQKAMENLEDGTTEQIEKKAQIAAIAFKIEKRTKQEQHVLQEKERAVYASAYERMKMTVDMYARQAGIKLVIRYNGESSDLLQRKELIETINRPIVYQDGIDITDDIIEAVNHGGPVAQTSP